MTVSKATLVSRFGQATMGSSAAVFVGAGVSMDAGFPNWARLLAFARRRLGLPASFDDLSLLAQYFVTTVPGGRNILEDEIIRQLQIDSAPTVTHRLLAELPIDEYWTTNYDSLLEDSMPGAQVLTEDHALARLENTFRRRVYKLHGTLHSGAEKPIAGAPNGHGPRLVVAREDFEQYPNTHPRMWAQLVASFLTKSILFVGIGFNDPNILHLFRLARERTGLRNREHFTLVRRPRENRERRLHDLRVADLASTGIRVCEVDEYGELHELLAALVRRTRDARVFVSGSVTNGDAEELLKLAGSLAADTGLSFITAGPAGRLMGYSFARALLAKKSYSPERLILYFQAEVDRASQIEMRFGTVRYYGSSRDEMRDQALSKVRAVLVTGGAEGTLDEVERAERQGIPVIPLASSGGMALKVWERMRSSLAGRQYGGRPIPEADFELLNHPDRNIVARHTIRLLLQAVYLDTDDTSYV